MTYKRAGIWKLWYGLDGVAALALGLLAWTQPLLAQSTNQAGLVVVHGDGRVVSRCVAFPEPQISGYDLLQRSDLDLNIEVSGQGAAICRIDGEGCAYPQQSCFCGTEGDSYIYWSYWQLANGGWQYSNLGSSNHLVQPGAVQGWVWGAGTSNSANPPPLLAFADVCAAPTATPTSTPTVTSTLTVPATDTPSPTPPFTETPLPPTMTPTNWPSPVPTATPTPFPTWTPVPPVTAPPTAMWTATPPPPQITLFVVNPSTVMAGQAATLLWQVQNANQVLLRSAEGESPMGPVGNLVVQPAQNTTYLLVARNGSGEVTATVDLTVERAATAVVATAQPVAPAALPATSLLPTPVATATPVPMALAVPTVTLPVLATLPPLTPTVAPPALPSAAISSPLAQLSSVTATPVVAILLNPVAAAPVTPVVAPDPGLTRLQLMTLLGGVVLVLIVPLGILGLAALIWMAKNSP